MDSGSYRVALSGSQSEQLSRANLDRPAPVEAHVSGTVKRLEGRRPRVRTLRQLRRSSKRDGEHARVVRVEQDGLLDGRARTGTTRQANDFVAFTPDG